MANITPSRTKIVDLKYWEFLVSRLPSSPNTGYRFIMSDHIEQRALYLVAGNSPCYLYSVADDGYTMLFPASSSNFGQGTAGTAHSWSTGSTLGVSSLTATAGTTSTITTNQNLQRNLRNYKVHIMSGPNAGQTLTIVSNTVGANSVITVPTQASAFDATTTYRLCIPRYYVWFATSSGRTFQIYDYATNSWLSPSTTGSPTTFGTDAALVSTRSWIGSDYVSFATGTATSATSTTLVNSGKSWTSSQWVNYQIRITGGTGAGQIRTITANDATSVTVATWTTTPDSTSTYSIEGNDDFLYLLGNNAVTMYRYSISGNSWTTLSPSVARAGAPGLHMTADWLCQSSDPRFTNESTILNGRRIYSHRGGGGNSIDYYDIPSNSWTGPIDYGPKHDAMGGSTLNFRYGFYKDTLIMNGQAESGIRLNQINLVDQYSDGFTHMPFFQAQAVSNAAPMSFVAVYRDSGTEIPYFYCVQPSSNQMMRMRF